MRESELLSHIFKNTPGPAGPVVVGPGDDLAQLKLDDMDLLIGVDQVIAGQHVDISRVGPELVARKAVCRCLSDVAAMGATPIAGVVTVAIPSSDEMINDAWIKKLSDSVHRVGQSFGCPIVGGDIAVLPEKGQALVLTVTVLATSHGSRVLLRSSAEIGDGVYVTGELGRTLEADGQGHHLHFVPRIELSLSLKEILGEDLHAMIDLSDGLARDVGHIAKASGVGIELEGAMIPRRNGASLHEAIADGEDYELCFTSSSEVNEVNGVPVARVGTVVDAARCHPCSVIVNDGITSHCVDNLGYEHVSRPSNAD